MVEKAGDQNGSWIHQNTAEVGCHSGSDDPSERMAQRTYSESLADNVSQY